MSTYCGNNAQHPRLLSGDVNLGTRYECMRKGIGRGMHMPYDDNFASVYTAIDKTRIYCGDKNDLPAGYDRMGSLVHCLQKGIGVGKRITADKGAPRFMLFYRVLLPILIIILLTGGLFTFLKLKKPSIVTEKDNRKIDWGKFMAFYIPVATLICILIFLLWKFYILKIY
jgi:hypothetical protein